VWKHANLSSDGFITFWEVFLCLSQCAVYNNSSSHHQHNYYYYYYYYLVTSSWSTIVSHLQAKPLSIKF
jgi:hypothetical protein